MKTIFALIAALLLYAQPALAAITHIGSLGTQNASTSGSTLVITTSATLEAGNIALVSLAADNVGTTDADHSEIATIVDSAGNSYAKVCEFTNGQAGAGAGATASLYMTKATTQLTSGGTITVTFANTIVARTVRANEFTVAGGMTLQQSSACQTSTNDGNDPASMAFSGLSSIERLYFRAIAEEGNSTTTITVTTNYTTTGAPVVGDTGSNATSIGLRGEFRIVTATGETSDPTTPGTLDGVSVFVALYEVPATITPDANSACTGIADSDQTPDFGTCSHTTGTLTNGILIFFAGLDDSDLNTQFTGCTYNSVAMSRYLRAALGNPTIEIWWLVGPSAGTNNLQCTFDSATAVGVSGVIATYSGVRQTTPFTDNQENIITAGTSSSVSVTCPNGMAVDVITSSTTADWVTSGANTEMRETDGADNTTSVSTLFGGGTMSWTFTTEVGMHVGVCLNSISMARAPIIIQ